MSWLSSLASFIPVVGPAVSAGLSFLTGGMGGSGNSNVPTDPLQNPTIQGLLKNLQTPATMDPNTAAASSFYRTALGGGEDATRTLLGPDVSTVLSQYDNASRAAAELGPRGGGRVQTQAEAPFLKAGAYGKLLAGVKQGAAQGEAGIGEAQTQAATARRGQNVSVLGSVMGGETAAADLAFKKQREQNTLFGGLGSGIGSLLTNLLAGKKNSGGDSGQPLNTDGTPNWGY